MIYTKTYLAVGGFGMDNNDKQKTEEFTSGISNQRKRLNFTLESQRTKPYNIEKMTAKNLNRKTIKTIKVIERGDYYRRNDFITR